MFLIKFKKTRKAQVFLMSALILASTAALGLSLVSVYLRNLKMVYQISESTKAFYLADACAEWRLYEWKADTEGDENAPLFSNGSPTSPVSCEYDFEYEKLDQIKTIGITRLVRRGINIYFADEFFEF